MHSLRELRGRASARLDAYTDTAGLYAFGTYDRGPATRRDMLLPEDILAANLLSLRLRWHDVIPLFAEGNGPHQALLATMNAALQKLAVAAPFETYRDFATLERALVPLTEANTATEDVTGWTAVTVSKVLHRHLPQIVPIRDSYVRKFYGVPSGRVTLLWERLHDDIRRNLNWLEPLAAGYGTPDGRPLSLLRAADIIIWTNDGVSSTQVGDSPAVAALQQLTPTMWDKEGLEVAGWDGFTPLLTLNPAAVPDVPGVYVVVRDSTDEPAFLPDRPYRGSGRQATSKHFAYRTDQLAARWITESAVMNIGKADVSLRNRLDQYRKYGAGTGAAHKGGRSIWQLEDADALLISWVPAPSGVTGRELERGLIAAFRTAHGARPFANLRD
nr:DUF6308 family protein [Serinicoccus sediminis]